MNCWGALWTVQTLCRILTLLSGDCSWHTRPGYQYFVFWTVLHNTPKLHPLLQNVLLKVILFLDTSVLTKTVLECSSFSNDQLRLTEKNFVHNLWHYYSAFALTRKTNALPLWKISEKFFSHIESNFSFFGSLNPIWTPMCSSNIFTDLMDLKIEEMESYVCWSCMVPAGQVHCSLKQIAPPEHCAFNRHDPPIGAVLKHCPFTRTCSIPHCVFGFWLWHTPFTLIIPEAQLKFELFYWFWSNDFNLRRNGFSLRPKYAFSIYNLKRSKSFLGESSFRRLGEHMPT